MLIMQIDTMKMEALVLKTIFLLLNHKTQEHELGLKISDFEVQDFSLGQTDILNYGYKQKFSFS